MKNDTYLNVLISYAYLNQQSAFLSALEKYVKTGKINVMFDSGAFTKFNAKGGFSHVNVDGYCNFLERYGDLAEKYVTLDVIGNAEATKRNYETMLQRGLSPMFVVTMYDKDYGYIGEAIKRNNNVCVAGGATTKGTWMIKRYQDIYRYSNKKAKIHGLGFVTYPKMLQLPLYSVDSSSWKAESLRFGSIQYFDNGLKKITYRQVLTRRAKLSYKHQQVLNGYKITPQMYSNLNYHKGNYSMEIMASTHANITLQKVCKRNNLDYFLAITNVQDLEKILYIDANYYDLSYEKFRKEFVK